MLHGRKERNEKRIGVRIDRDRLASIDRGYVSDTKPFVQLEVVMPLVVPIVFVDPVHGFGQISSLRGDCAGDVVVVQNEVRGCKCSVILPPPLARWGLSIGPIQNKL